MHFDENKIKFIVYFSTDPVYVLYALHTYYNNYYKNYKNFLRNRELTKSLLMCFRQIYEIERMIIILKLIT